MDVLEASAHTEWWNEIAEEVQVPESISCENDFRKAREVTSRLAIKDDLNHGLWFKTFMSSWLNITKQFIGADGIRIRSMRIAK